MSERRLVVLILGGYGTFGGRLAGLLADEGRLTLVIAGRSPERAAAFCRTLGGAARAVPAAIDRAGITDRLGALAPDILVDATGPFQAYGADPYPVVRACLAHGVHYLDLADGAGFVEGIARFDAQARAGALFVLSGVSSFPVLTAAVVEHLRRDVPEVRAVTGGIAPSPYAGVGPNVIRAVAGYAGQPLRLRRAGRDATGYALTESLAYTVAPPGRLPLRTTRFSLVDVPDLHVLPRRLPALADVWMGAGPVPEILHRMLSGLAWLVRGRLLPSLAFLAPLIGRVVNVVRWGEHRGGMFVELRGTDADGRPMTASWHLLAEGSDGPLIPSMAVEALIRKRLAGARPAPGARPAVGALDLADYDALFAGRSIRTGIRRDSARERALPLYARLLGDAWERLPDAVRSMHDGTTVRAEGRAEIERGTHPLARAAAWAFGFPPAGTGVPLSVSFERTRAGEIWARRFGRHAFRSHHAERGGRWRHLLVERFGPVTFGVALVVEGARLHFVVRRWAVLGLPLPLRLAPVSRAWEGESDGEFRFDVDLSHPLVGRIVRYRGRLRGAAPVAGLALHPEGWSFPAGSAPRGGSG